MASDDFESAAEDTERTIDLTEESLESTLESTLSQLSDDDVMPDEEPDDEPDEHGVYNYYTGGDEFPELDHHSLKPPYKTFKPPFKFSKYMKFAPSEQIYLSHVDQRDFIFWKILVFMYEYPPHVFTEVSIEALGGV